jgi:hypothetical protein
MSGESGLRFPEFLGFTAKTLNRNATQIHHGKLEILQIQSLWNLFQLFPKEKNGKNMPREVDRVRSSIDTLGERRENASNLQRSCRSLISTPWSLRTLSLTRFWSAGDGNLLGATGGRGEGDVRGELADQHSKKEMRKLV